MDIKQATVLFVLLIILFSPRPSYAQSPPRQATMPPYSQNVEAAGHLGGKTEALFYQNDYLYAGFGPELAVLDISMPTHPKRIGYVVLPDIIGDIDVVGSYAYIIDSDRQNLWVVDVSEPTKPIQVGFLDQLGSVNDITVVDNYAYLITRQRGLVILDISNPATPLEINFFTTEWWWNAHDVVVTNGYAYVATYQKGLGIADLSDPTNPVNVGIYEEEKSIYKVSLFEGYLYLNSGKDLQVFDISDPPALREVETYNLPPDQSMLVVDSYAYFIDEMGNLQVLDVSNALVPTEVAVYETWQNTQNLALIKPTDEPTHAYLVAEGGKQIIVDVSRANEPTISAVRHNLMPSLLGVTLKGNYAYQIGGHSGVYGLDLSAPTALKTIVYVYRTVPSFVPLDFFTVGDYAYLVGGLDGLRILDVSTPAIPRRVSDYTLPYFWTYRLTVAGDYAYLLGYTATYPYNYNGNKINHFSLRIVDISDPATPIQVGNYDLPNWAWDVVIRGDYAYVVDGRGGLHILDVSNPTRPSQVGLHYLPNQAYAIAIDNTPATDAGPTYAYVAAGVDGLRVIDISDPFNPFEFGFYDTAGLAWDVEVAGENIYLADNVGGLMILRLAESASSPPPPSDTPLGPVISPISPYELLDQIEKNGIEALEPIWHEIDDDTKFEVVKDYRVRAKLFDVERDTTIGPDVILQITVGWDVHYRLFAKHDQQWELLGYVNSFVKYGVEEPRIVTKGNDDIWLVIGQDSGGTGIFEQNEIWYWVGDKVPKMVLSYAQEGYLIDPTLYGKIYTGVISTYSEDLYTLEVNYQADYRTRYFPDEELSDIGILTINSIVRYVWQPASKEFILDPTQSDLSQKQIDSIFTPISEQFNFPTQHFEELVRLVMTGDDSQKKWLDQYLNDSKHGPKDSPEKKLLLEMLLEFME